MLESYLGKGGGAAAGDIVDGQASVVDQRPLGPAVPNLGDSVVRPFLILEEHDGRPVVRHVLGEGAGCAGRLLHEVVAVHVHGDIEGVAADDLVEMRRVEHARVDQGVDSVDDELGAGEPQHGLSGNALHHEGRSRERKVLLHLLGRIVSSSSLVLFYQCG